MLPCLVGWVEWFTGGGSIIPSPTFMDLLMRFQETDTVRSGRSAQLVLALGGMEIKILQNIYREKISPAVLLKPPPGL